MSPRVTLEVDPDAPLADLTCYGDGTGVDLSRNHRGEWVVTAVDADREPITSDRFRSSDAEGALACFLRAAACGADR